MVIHQIWKITLPVIQSEIARRDYGKMPQRMTLEGTIRRDTRPAGGTPLHQAAAPHHLPAPHDNHGCSPLHAELDTAWTHGLVCESLSTGCHDNKSRCHDSNQRVEQVLCCCAVRLQDSMQKQVYASFCMHLSTPLLSAPPTGVVHPACCSSRHVMLKTHVPHEHMHSVDALGQTKKLQSRLQ